MARNSPRSLLTRPALASIAECGGLPAPKNPKQPRLRAALFNPPDPTSSETRNRWIPPLGLAYVASVARNHAFHVDLFDFSRELRLDVDTLERAGSFDYRVFGISSYTETWSSTLQLVAAIRARVPDATIVVGGYHASIVSMEVMRDYPDIDLVVRNEGEESFTRALATLAAGHRDFSGIPGLLWRRGSNDVVVNEDATRILDVDRLPQPVLDYRYSPENPWFFTASEQQSNKRTVGVVSSRGCPKRCSFCSIIVMSPDYRLRSVESLMDEIRHRHAQEPFGHVAFMDANFFVKVSRTVAFAEALHAFDPTITWSGTATADQVCRHAEVLRRLGALNCAYLEVGIESGNTNSLQRFNKKTKLSHNEQAIALLREADIGICFDFIMFEPEMTLADFVENVRFLYRNDFFGYWPCEFLFQELRLFPGTPLRAVYEERTGQTFLAHEMPVTPFFDSAVRNAWLCMSWYREHYHGRVNKIIRGLIDPLNRLMYSPAAKGCSTPALVAACQRGHAAVVHLRHLAYRFLESLLSLEDGLRADGGVEELVSRLDLRDFDSQIEEGGRALSELLHAAAELGLEDVARSWATAEANP